MVPEQDDAILTPVSKEDVTAEILAKLLLAVSDIIDEDKKSGIDTMARLNGEQPQSDTKA